MIPVGIKHAMAALTPERRGQSFLNLHLFEEVDA